MDKKDLEKLLMRFSHLGVTHSKNGALLIGKPLILPNMPGLILCTLVLQKQKYAIWRRNWDVLFLKFTGIF
jgi:hypothetical protein